MSALRYKMAMSAGLASLLAGCFTMPEDVPIKARPDTAPTRTITSFSASLRCMDDLFIQYGISGWLVTSDGIPDATGEVSAGTKEMLISSISQASVKSNAFNFVDFESQSNVTVLASFLADPNNPNVPVPPGFEIPNHYVRGAISQLDSGVVAESVGAGAALSVGDYGGDVGVSADQVASVVSVDLNIGDVFTRQMLPGVSASNSITVRRTGKAADAGATIDKLGLNFNLSFDRSEGVHAAVRTLIELSVIEVLGKLSQVPYWRCLEIDQTNTEVETQARDWFAQMSSEERVTFVQRALKGMGLYQGEVTGTLDAPTEDAIGTYQSREQQIANGEINFDLYASLIASDLSLGLEPDPKATPIAFEPSTAPASIPVSVNLSTSRGPENRYFTGDKLELFVEPTADAFTYCYYRDSQGQVSRLFPNRFAPDALLRARQTLPLPGAAPFDLLLDTPGGKDEVMCLASSDELGPLLPGYLQAEDLVPLTTQGLEDIELAFNEAAKKFGNAQVSTSRVAVNVIAN